MLKLFNMPVSGNCYKVRLLLAHLGLQAERVDIDPARPETRPAELRELNPAGRAPTLVLEDGRVLPESNAILVYLSEGTPYLPADPYQRACVLAWMFFEQNLHEPNIATRRFFVGIKRDTSEVEAQLGHWKSMGEGALSTMQRHLAQQPFFGPGQYSVADIALYAYTHVAHEGGFDLSSYPAIEGWLERVRSQAGHIPMDG